MRALSDPTRLRIVALLERTNCPSTSCRRSPDGAVPDLDPPGSAAGLRPGRNPGAKANGRSTGWTGQRQRRSAEFIPLAIRGAKELPEHAGDQINLRRILRRREQAQVYFNQVAGRFDRVYGPGPILAGVWALLLRILPPLVVADLGSGEGLLSELLARRCKKVIAVDNSEKIVAFGAAKAKRNNLKNLEFRLGTCRTRRLSPGAWTW